MAWDGHGKRQAGDLQDQGLEAKRPRKTETESKDLCGLCESVYAQLEGPGDKSKIRQGLHHLIVQLQDVSYGYRSIDCKVALKRQLLRLLPPLAKQISAASNKGDSLVEVVGSFVDCIVRSGFAQSSRDRRDIIASGAWLMCMEPLKAGKPEDVVSAVHIYLHLSDHVGFYDDFIGMHSEFWHPSIFREILKHMPTVLHLPDSLQADEWELRCPDIEAAIKCLFCFLLFWTAKEPENRFTFEIPEALPLLNAALDAIEKYDLLFGSEIGAKCRGDPLEELIRILGLLTQFVVEKIDSQETNEQNEEVMQQLQQHAAAVLRLLVRLLKLKIPTCGAKPEAITDGPIPVDERQQDSEWIQNLFERLSDEEPPVSAACLMDVFRAMVDMPLEEQRYRLECLAPMVPRFMAGFVDQLRQKTVPPELADFKIVMNNVLQECATSFALELLEEVSFYPCLLDFTTKRAMLHAQCDRVRLTQGSGDPIRIVVPRDNVLDGVCSTLNLQDSQARIDVPLEIEIRAGYSDDTGNELVDEGEDQGGPRRQWLDRACRYFIASDLFMSPAEDAAHLEFSQTSRQRGARGIIVPSPEPVCQCVQEDWTEQFELFGCVIGFAILNKETVPVHFGHNFLRSVFGLKTDTADLLPLLEHVDKTLHTKLTYILSGSYKDLGDTLEDVLEQSHLPRTFVVSESHCQELVRSTPLLEGGDRMSVTEENKEKFVQLLLDRILISGVAQQVQYFQRGLLRVVPHELVQRITGIMSVKEIELMLCGADGIDVDDWEKYTEYENGYTSESVVVRWFWEVVREMPQHMRAQLLSFSTGSSQVPSGGFRFLQPELFTIQRVGVTDRFPAAHTCANTLDLPEYTSKAVLEQHLRFALEETGDSFGLR
ncbi:E3 ubiquitin-protein ligase UPL2 (Ubiquitin-protein ligase 2) (HECT-type E3 ubiquitin transferase UPL2) [Durusdinium trenchii]|uniref:HECT-type E3 ubiquitin transferase n=1 Tax=Durusdinium trenchii TaxID=1381693 RepID=A0ABP0IJU8_9DINO